MENSKLKELLIKTDDAQWKYVDQTRKLDKCFLITMKEKRNQTQADVLTFCGLRFFILGTNKQIYQTSWNQSNINQCFIYTVHDQTGCKHAALKNKQRWSTKSIDAPPTDAPLIEAYNCCLEQKEESNVFVCVCLHQIQ